MEYKKLDQLRNTYPTDSETISQNYTSDDATIKYSGLYPDPPINNFITFDIIDLNGINSSELHEDPELDINFIVQFNDGDSIEQWTSKKLKDKLLAAIEEPNPFYTKRNVTIANIDLIKLKNYWKSRKFDIPEKYAEVRITDTLTTIKDMLTHIDWIVSTDAIDDELREVKTFGSWTLYTTEDDLGFGYSEDIDSLTNGDLDGDVIVTKVQEEQLKPFGQTGATVGATRELDGNIYSWSGVGWVLI